MTANISMFEGYGAIAMLGIGDPNSIGNYRGPYKTEAVVNGLQSKLLSGPSKGSGNHKLRAPHGGPMEGGLGFL